MKNKKFKKVVEYDYDSSFIKSVLTIGALMLGISLGSSAIQGIVNSFKNREIIFLGFTIIGVVLLLWGFLMVFISRETYWEEIK